VGRLSEVAGMPRTAFSRLFTTVVGQPPASYLTGWRLNRAAQLLREPTPRWPGSPRRSATRPNSPSRPPSAASTACRRDGSAVLRPPDTRSKRRRTPPTFTDRLAHRFSVSPHVRGGQSGQPPAAPRLWRLAFWSC
jgi:hypothetical protein